MTIYRLTHCQSKTEESLEQAYNIARKKIIEIRSCIRYAKNKTQYTSRKVVDSLNISFS
jgi:bacterioferritin (cytochrome b1)